MEIHQCQCPQNAVAGVPELATVKNTAATLAKTTKQAITFDTYLELLMTATQQHDINIDKTHPTNKCQPLLESKCSITIVIISHMENEHKKPQKLNHKQ